MMQEFDPIPFQHLMIFLRETPPDGIDGFQHQIVHHATYDSEGSQDKCLLYDRIGDETKIKVLVTGQIELNEKNVFIGLKMAFPEWDFQRYPLIIQKLFLKKPAWNEAKEVGAIATTERTTSREGNTWGLPCVLNLSPGQQNELYTRSASKAAAPSWYERISIRDSIDKEREDFSDSLNEMEDDQGETQQNFDEIDFKHILDLADDLSDIDLPQDVAIDPSNQLNIQQGLLTNKELTEENQASGAVSKEFLNAFGEDQKSSAFTGSDEDEEFDFSFLDKAITFSPSFDEMDDREKFFTQDRIESHPFTEEEDDFISPEFLESELEFELEGFVEESEIGEDASLPIAQKDRIHLPSFIEAHQETINKIQSTLVNRVKSLPLRKITRASLVIGLAALVLSLGVKVFEPDYESTRKAAGVVDLYDWIIINDLVGEETETDALMDLWQESSEYRQFWLWFDTQWVPQITRYEKIEAGLRTTGWIILSPAIIILLITSLTRSGVFNKKFQSGALEYGPNNKISLQFATYTNDWALVDGWAKESGFKILEVEDARRLYRKKATLTHPPILCLIAIMDGQVQLDVWVSTRVPTFLIPLLSDLGLEVLEAKKANLPSSTKNLVNKLLLKLGHPPLA